MLHDLHVTRLHENAVVPVRATEGAAGHDLFAAEAAVVPANGRVLIRTGIRVGLPLGTYGRVAPRSGLALKHGLDVLAGVVDEDYKGEVGVVLHNTTGTDYSVSQGDRVAQLIIEEIRHVVVHELADDGTLVTSGRNAGGFGSTGK